jgi:hypothetical protein
MAATPTGASRERPAPSHASPVGVAQLAPPYPAPLTMRAFLSSCLGLPRSCQYVPSWRGRYCPAGEAVPDIDGLWAGSVVWCRAPFQPANPPSILKPIGFLRLTLLTPAALAVFVLAGCGDASEDMVRTGNTEVKVKKDGSLTAVPPPLTLQQVNSKTSRSPEGAVYRLWFWAQWGSLPNVVLSYDPVVRRTVGPANIAGAYALLRSELLATRPRVVAVSRTRAGMFVALHEQRRALAPSRESFLLRRSGGGWTIVYDTLLERGLQTYAQQGLEPNKPPSGRALTAGQALAARYRNSSAARPPP